MGAGDPLWAARQLAWANLALKPPAAAFAARRNGPNRRGALRKRDLYDRLIVEHSRRHGLDPRLVKSIIAVESEFTSRCTSASGAVGLMQVMPETAEEMGVPRDLLSDPEANIRAGTAYLSTLFRVAWRQFDLEGTDYTAAPLPVRRRIIAAYHGGPRMLVLPAWPEATRDYVGKVLILAGAGPSDLRLSPPQETPAYLAARSSQ
jgi:soluble lytic murein transglycosylase-like protein